MDAHIIDLFKQNLMHLKKRLNVSILLPCSRIHKASLFSWVQSDAVLGQVSLTCDAWQASNQDTYFAVTGHWIEESAPGIWEQKSALFGFMQMNTAHNGVRLGHVLYKIAKRLGIAHKAC
jgi:hypothetical protein